MSGIISGLTVIRSVIQSGISTLIAAIQRNTPEAKAGLNAPYSSVLQKIAADTHTFTQAVTQTANMLNTIEQYA